MKELKKAIIKDLDYFRYKKGQSEVYLEAVELLALRVATAFDSYRFQERRKRIDEIIESYDERDKIVFDRIIGNLNEILGGMPDRFGDHLGELYMETVGNQKGLAQFFTPYSTSKVAALIAFDETILDKEMVTIGEPACGAGGMVLAVLEEMDRRGINYAERALIVANDIDRRCVNMCYLQLSYAGAAAVVKRQNTITQETFDTFITPAFALNHEKFSKVYKGLSAEAEM